MNRDYTIGLDIGTSSVGWAAIDDEYKILEYQGKHAYGVRLFDTAEHATPRRVKRGSRRRYRRRRRRLELLQLLFQAEINKIDANFFHVLAKEEQWLSDKDNRFINKSLSEILMYLGEEPSKYPTIYHLQADIINHPDKQFDLRLVYIAIYAFVKKRGHFLEAGNYKDFRVGQIDLNMVSEVLKQFLAEDYDDDSLNAISDKIIDIVTNTQTTKTDKKRLFKDIAGIEKNDKKAIEVFSSLLIGSGVELKSFYNLSDNIKLDFTKEGCLDEISNGELSDKIELFEAMYTIYLSLRISKLMDGQDYICNVYVNNYNVFKEQLKQLKQAVKSYDLKLYKELFVTNQNICLLDKYLRGDFTNKGNISKLKKLDYDSFTKTLIKKLEFLKTLDNVYYQEITTLISEQTYLMSLNKMNAAIPYQIKTLVVEQILQSQKEFHSNLITNAFITDIIKIITFKIPYYIGPIDRNNNSSFSWLEVKKQSKITPLNFDEAVNKDVSAHNFITRMTNKCSYLFNVDPIKIDNNVLPKHSLLIQDYEVMNELNNIRVEIIDEQIRKLTIGERLDIYEHIFKSKQTIKHLDIKKYLSGNNNIDIEDIKITGTAKESEFAAKLTSYHKFKKILGADFNIDDIEKVIYILTVFNDQDIIKKQLQTVSSINNNIEQISKLQFSGWAKFCKFLLIGINNQSLGDYKYYEAGTIMGELFNNKLGLNFQSIVTSDALEFNKIINGSNKNLESSIITFDDIEQLQGSHALKRGIWQSIRVIQELVEKFGEPKYVAIEMAREDQQKGKRTQSRKSLYEQLAKKNNLLDNKLVSEDEVFFRNDRMWLYLMQGGKCMYSKQALDINNLSSYDIDHIYPQSLIVDDSLDNKVLVLKAINASKSANQTAYEVATKEAINYWNILLEKQMISQKKYSRLMKQKFSDGDYERFTKRALVETRQITKHVSNLINKQYPEVKVFGIKAKLTTDFRKIYEIYKNRDFNNKHHAVDAYLTAFAQLAASKLYFEDFLDTSNKVSENLRLKHSTKFKVTDKLSHIATLPYYVKNHYLDDDINIVEFINEQINKPYLISNHLDRDKIGNFWDETLYLTKSSRRASKLNAKYDTSKIKHYGENKQINISSHTINYLLLVEVDKISKKSVDRIRRLISIKTIDMVNCKSDYEVAKKYYDNLDDNFKYSNISVICKITKGQPFYMNGKEYTFVGEKEMNKSYEIVVPNKITDLSYFVENKDLIMNRLSDTIIYLIYRLYYEVGNYSFDELIKISKVEKLNIYDNKITRYTYDCIDDVLNINKDLLQINADDKFCLEVQKLLNKYLDVKQEELIMLIKDNLITNRVEVFNNEKRFEKMAVFKIINKSEKSEDITINLNSTLNELMKLYSHTRSDEIGSFTRLTTTLSAKLNNIQLIHRSVTGLDEVVSVPLSEMKKVKQKSKKHELAHNNN